MLHTAIYTLKEPAFRVALATRGYRSIAGFCREVDVSRSTIHRLLRGTPTSLATAHALSQIMGETTSSLFDLVGGGR